MMTACDSACSMIAGMLAAGPRDAAEILAAVEGDRISARTAQRAAISLGVVKVKAGLRGGWTWSLPADDAEAPAPSTPTDGKVSIRVDLETAQVVARVSVPERAATIAARLRKLEAGRGKTAPIYALDPRLLRWVAAGISDPQLREAYELAVYALERKLSQAALKIGGGGPVTVGCLDEFVAEVLAETPA